MRLYIIVLCHILSDSSHTTLSTLHLIEPRNPLLTRVLYAHDDRERQLLREPDDCHARYV
jgi:hypothetical protein